MFRWIAVAVTSAFAFTAAGVLGGADAQTSTSPTPPRTIAVGGSSHRPLAQGAELATANAAYRGALADAIDSAKAKAEFIAAKLGGALDAPRSVTEGGGDVWCGDYDTDYTGAYPDTQGASFAGGDSPLGRFAAPGASAPAPTRHRHKRRKRRRAHAAAVGSCSVSASVTVVYALAGG